MCDAKSGELFSVGGAPSNGSPKSRTGRTFFSPLFNDSIVSSRIGYERGTADARDCLESVVLMAESLSRNLCPAKIRVQQSSQGQWFELVRDAILTKPKPLHESIRFSYDDSFLPVSLPICYYSLSKLFGGVSPTSCLLFGMIF